MNEPTRSDSPPTTLEQRSLSQGATATRRKRKSTPRHPACAACRADHKACDGLRPCSRCIGKNRAATCAPLPSKKRIGRPRTKDGVSGEEPFLSTFTCYVPQNVSKEGTFLTA